MPLKFLDENLTHTVITGFDLEEKEITFKGNIVLNQVIAGEDVTFNDLQEPPSLLIGRVSVAEATLNSSIFIKTN